MDNVPVKIAENYKPPPRLYQLPQAIANKISQSPSHYHESPQYLYDFQLERKVLAKMSEWRRLRHLEREARRERKEKREQQRLEKVEQQQKQLLGAVTYPDAEEYCLTDSDEEEEEEKISDEKMEFIEKKENVIAATQPSSFHNILQPTILVGCHTGSLLNASGIMANAFNYKDFEDDTSSPFDNIELKAISDLDILAQVLHDTQLKAREQQREKIGDNNAATKENLDNSHDVIATYLDNSNASLKAVSAVEQVNSTTSNILMQDTLNLAILENTKAALEKVDFNNLSQELQNENIPNTVTDTTIKEANQSQLQQIVSNNHIYQQTTAYTSLINQQQSHQQQQQQQQHTFIPYNNIYNGLEQTTQPHQHHQQKYTNFNLQTVPSVDSNGIYKNQNIPYTPSSVNCNGGTAYYSPTHHNHNTHFVGHNANSYLNHNITENSMLTPPHNLLFHNPHLLETEIGLKSKSVPDILKELSDEVRNSEIRRSRNHSYTVDDDKAESDEEEKTPTETPTKAAIKQTVESVQYYAKLEKSEQKLAKNISSMGFPLERVSKITQMFGADDKKIIEHLIPLSELIDLGFDETKISDALMKFDNNKEKALEYLIS